MEVFEFVKRCLDGEAVVLKKVGGWKTSQEEKVRRVDQASYAEKGDEVVHSGLVIVTFCMVVLMRVS